MQTKAVLDEPTASGATAAALAPAPGDASVAGTVSAYVRDEAAAERPTEDRRITRTKRALRGALIALMEERGLDAITVNDLCARADINRGTFYNHYRDKDDLLAVLENEVLADLDRYQVQMADLSLPVVMACQKLGRPLPLLVSLFEYLKDQGDFLHAVLGPGGDGGFGPRLRDSICTNLVESILHERYRDNPTPFVRYYVSFFASAYLGVIERWICTGMKESPQEMALISLRLLFIKPGERIEL
jgi:AcrR family transcriptional regulator